MRGQDVGRLVVFRVPTTVNASPLQVVDANTDISGDKTLFERMGEQEGGWKTASVDIQAGNFILGFRATASPSKPLSRPGIAIDDVKLTKGSCSNLGMF